jgi:hypothetical protein
MIILIPVLCKCYVLRLYLRLNYGLHYTYTSQDDTHATTSMHTPPIPNSNEILSALSEVKHAKEERRLAHYAFILCTSFKEININNPLLYNTCHILTTPDFGFWDRLSPMFLRPMTLIISFCFLLLTRIIPILSLVRGCIQKSPDWVDNEINTRWETTQSVMAAKHTRLTHKIAIQLHLVAESCIICSSRSRRPVRKLLDTPSYSGSF